MGCQDSMFLSESPFLKPRRSGHVSHSSASSPTPLPPTESCFLPCWSPSPPPDRNGEARLWKQQTPQDDDGITLSLAKPG